LYNFNRPASDEEVWREERVKFDAADYKYFRQALLEMRNSSNDSLFIPFEELETHTLPDSLTIVPIAGAILCSASGWLSVAEIPISQRCILLSALLYVRLAQKRTGSRQAVVFWYAYHGHCSAG
jgi:hypothetical protein